MTLLVMREQNKQHVIETALDCFIELGIEQTKISYIAKCAGLTERSVYRYFDNKAELVLQSALLFWDHILTRVGAAREKAPASASGLDEIYRILLEYSELYFSDRQKLIFAQEAEVYLNKCGTVGLLSNKPPRGFADSSAPLANAIRRGLKDGSVSAHADAELLYYNAYDSLLGLMQKMAVTQESSSTHDLSARKRLQSFCYMLAQAFTEPVPGCPPAGNSL